MRIIFFVIVYFTFSSLFSQNKIDEEINKYLSSPKQFKFEELINKKFEHSVNQFDNIPERLRNHYDTIAIRDLDFGVQEAIYSIKLYYIAEDDAVKHLQNNLHVLSRGSTIFGIIRNDLSQNKITPYFDNNLMNRYINQHDSLYRTKTTQNDLIKALITQSDYGYLCGIAPTISAVPQRNGLWFDNVKNIGTFRKWLKSYSPEEQAYGVDALSYLYNKPPFATAKRQENQVVEDKKLIEQIKKRNSTIRTCSGCIYGIYRKVY